MALRKTTETKKAAPAAKPKTQAKPDVSMMTLDQQQVYAALNAGSQA